MIKLDMNLLDKQCLTMEHSINEEFIAQFVIENNNGFWNFCKYLDPTFFYDEKTALHKFADLLQKVSQGIIKKLIVNMMSRTGKSYITTMWCLYSLGHNPTGSIMRNAYGDKLATKFSRDIRKVIGLPGATLDVTKRYHNIFPNIKLDPRQQGVYDWALDNAKDISYSCTGMTGAAKGQGCDIALILDDPSKDEKESISDTMHEDVWTKYLMTHRDRKADEDVAEIIIMTRANVADITGKLEEVEGLVENGGVWTKFVYPALDEKDKSFCEAMKTTKHLLHERNVYKKANQLQIWETQFQQNPEPREGYTFPVDELQRFKVDELRTDDETARYVTVDFADAGDDFLSAPCAKIYGRLVYVTDVLFTREPAKITEGLLSKLFLSFLPHKAKFEANSGGNLFAEMVKRNIRNLISTYIKVETSSSNKHTRILSRSGIILENFYFLDENEYEIDSNYAKFIKNLTTYRNDGKSKHDDAADSVAMLVDLVGVGGGKTTVIGY